tara:strand:+ start:484 stop:2928 length:2445 start_codon:yes stop_codon:yes gene_type:complete
MTSSRTRLAVLSGVFVVALGIVLLHLWFLMVQENDAWARRSYENRWAFRSVPSQRGQLFDRDGERLAWDEPTTRASIYYHRFRLYHVVGAAVHGATLWASLQPLQKGTTYSYFDGVLGPRVAAEDLLSMPVAVFEGGVLEKADFGPLAKYATTVLSVCSGLPRKKVYAAMRKAATAGANLGIGDVLAMSRSELLQRFDERLQKLHELDSLFEIEQQNHNARLGRTTVNPTLIESLERLRRDSLDQRKVVLEVKKDEAGKPVLDDNGRQIPVRWGSLIEDIRRYFANDVAFELAASLRVNQSSYPGIGVDPAIRRVRRGDSEDLGRRDTSLDVIIGEVRSNDRLIKKKPTPVANGDESAPKSVPASERLPEEWRTEWRNELVPDDVVADEDALEHMRKEADRRYLRDTLVNERSGISGMEAVCDQDLTGKLGMRFVEHDSRRREHRLWSHLRVESGKDAQLTIDVDLQDLAEEAVVDALAKYRGEYDDPADKDKVEACLAIIDALTGDVLALAGAPIRGEARRRMSGLVWEGNGSIGSLVKPFVLLEHLESQRLGRPCLAAESVKPCEQEILLGGRRLRCEGMHWGHGVGPVVALAKSCNIFFYQAGNGLGADGFARALKRFGLLRSVDGDPFSGCWQPSVRGLRIAAPRLDPNISLPRRSIGYGVQVPALFIARAYAGVATGILPEVDLRLGGERTFVPLGDIGESLAVVHEAMAECVQTGTAASLPMLKELDVRAKTGTAEISRVTKQNNGWFAGFIPWTGRGGMQIAFCAVVYRVPKSVHGDEAAGGMLVEFLHNLDKNPELRDRYLTEEGQ